LFYFWFEFSQLPTNQFINSLLIISQIGTGIFEELFFRVILFYLIYCILKDKSLIKALVVTSILFGLSHFTNLIDSDNSLPSVINQCIFAYSLGIIFQLIFLKTRSIFIGICLHGVWDYFATKDILTETKEVLIQEQDYTFLDIIQGSSAWMVFALIITGVGLVIVRIGKQPAISCD